MGKVRRAYDYALVKPLWGSMQIALLDRRYRTLGDELVNAMFG